MDILMVGFAGLKFSLNVAKTNEDSLLSRFPRIIFERLKDYECMTDSAPVEAALREMDMSYVALGEEGLYKGLWELGETFNTGLSIHLSAVPVLQETIEISEFLGINPYTHDSTGCVIMLCQSAEETIKSLKARGIEAALVGKTTSSKDRVVFYDENRLYLTPKGE